MQIHRSIFDFKASRKSILTLGTFDGVHLGHQKLLKKLEKAKQNCDCETVVLTFFPHPRMVLQQENDIKLLNTTTEKMELFECFGIDHVIIHPFDQVFSELTPIEFVRDILVKQLNISSIIIGYDHRFGKNRAASIEDLVYFGKQFNFEVAQISAEEINDISISSTKIRNALIQGNILGANQYLGYNYKLSGTVIEGKKIGRTIAFPTANILLEEPYKLIPLQGAYIVKTIYHNQIYYGMMNIGFNPTFQEQHQSIEVHLLGFNENIYGERLSIELLERIRSEIKFDSVEKLKVQLLEDKNYTEAYIKAHAFHTST